jgi:hypothetical protein
MIKDSKVKSLSPEKQHATDVWIQILLPILIVSVLSLAAGLFLTQASLSNTQVANQWAHISIIFLILPLVFIGILFLGFILIISRLTSGLNKLLPPKLFAFRKNIESIAKSFQFKANKPANLVITFRGLIHGLSSIFRKLASHRSRK